jgi:hypothetical protein
VEERLYCRYHWLALSSVTQERMERDGVNVSKLMLDVRALALASQAVAMVEGGVGVTWEFRSVVGQPMEEGGAVDVDVGADAAEVVGRRTNQVDMRAYTARADRNMEATLTLAGGEEAFQWVVLVEDGSLSVDLVVQVR